MQHKKALFLFSLLHCSAAIRWSNSDVPKIGFTVEAANGTSQHEAARILCYPLTWPSLATFLLGNFAAHIATVQSTPGEKWQLTTFNMILALFFPTSGLMRGMNALVRNFSSSSLCRNVVAKILRVERWLQEETGLDKACKAGALCMVVRNSNWRPRPGGNSIPARLSTMNKEAIDKSLGLELRLMGLNTARNGMTLDEGQNDGTEADLEENIVSGTSLEMHPQETVFEVHQPTWLKENQSPWWTFFDTLWGRNIIDTTLISIHGSYRLPEGYSFAILPRNTIVRATMDPTETGPIQCKIASSQSVLKILVSIAQLLAASYTLWLHRGNQVSRWGFASFAFVPIPYAAMSLINGLSHLFTPDYPSIYMVSSGVMQEAIDAGGIFLGVVGHVVPVPTSDDDTGYGSGLDSHWEGLAPNIFSRSCLKFFNMLNSRKREEKDIVVCEQTLPPYEDSDEQLSSLRAHIPVANRTMLPLLLVEQSSDHPGGSYFIKPVHSSKITSDVPHLVAVLQVLGPIGGIVTIPILYYKLLRHPKRTWKNVKAAFIVLRHRWDEETTASIRTLRTVEMSLRKAFLSAYKAALLNLSEKIRQDNLPRLSFRACERFQRKDDIEVLIPITPNTPPTVTQALGAHESHPPVRFQKRREVGLQIRGITTQATLGIFVSSLSLLIIGLMSRFQAGSSSLTEQVVLMMWLALGTVVGFVVPFVSINDAVTLFMRVPLEYLAGMDNAGLLDVYYWTVVVVCLPWGIFVLPIWGFVIVGQQLDQWGTCVTLY